MQSKHILLSGALLTTLIFAGCRPQQTTTEQINEESIMADTQLGETSDNGMMTASGSPSADVSDGVMVGGAMMLPNRPIVVNAADAQNLTTLVAAVKQAGLVETLSGVGPYTVFAPTNAAFEKVPVGTMQSLMTPEKKAQLNAILTYHVVPGNLDSSMLTNGKKLKTVQGEELTVVVEDGTVMIRDAKGNVATVETPDVTQSNGVVHVIDTVLMPNKM